MSTNSRIGALYSKLYRRPTTNTDPNRQAMLLEYLLEELEKAHSRLDALEQKRVEEP